MRTASQLGVRCLSGATWNSPKLLRWRNALVDTTVWGVETPPGYLSRYHVHRDLVAPSGDSTQATRYPGIARWQYLRPFSIIATTGALARAARASAGTYRIWVRFSMPGPNAGRVPVVTTRYHFRWGLQTGDCSHRCWGQMSQAQKAKRFSRYGCSTSLLLCELGPALEVL